MRKVAVKVGVLVAVFGVAAVVTGMSAEAQPRGGGSAPTTQPETPTPAGQGAGAPASCGSTVGLADAPRSADVASRVPLDDPAVAARLRGKPGTLVPDASIQVSIIDGSRGDQVAITADGAGRLVGEVDGVQAQVLPRQDGLQIVGVAEGGGGGIATLEIDNELRCGDARLEMEQATNGAVALYAVSEQSRTPLAWIAEPWAIDREGREVPTWFEVDGTVVRQHVDTSQAALPVTFDPRYYSLVCDSGYYAARNAYEFLDMTPNDPGWCPVFGMFFNTNGYFPVWGDEDLVWRSNGFVLVNTVGDDCTLVPPTGPYWDFWIPCQAHDYCYDLRKASFDGTVSDGDCDSWFYWLMEAHCRERAIGVRDLCRMQRDTYYAGVILPWVVTNPDPAPVKFMPLHSLKCLDVKDWGMNDWTVIQQWQCNGSTAQSYRIWASPGDPGYFDIKPVHSGHCVTDLSWHLWQMQCDVGGWASRFWIQGAFNQNNFTLRPLLSGLCVDVPGSNTGNGIRPIIYNCFETSNQRWYIT